MIMIVQQEKYEILFDRQENYIKKTKDEMKE